MLLELHEHLKAQLQLVPFLQLLHNDKSTSTNLCSGMRRRMKSMRVLLPEQTLPFRSNTQRKVIFHPVLPYKAEVVFISSVHWLRSPWRVRLAL